MILLFFVAKIVILLLIWFCLCGCISYRHYLLHRIEYVVIEVVVPVHFRSGITVILFFWGMLGEILFLVVLFSFNIHVMTHPSFYKFWTFPLALTLTPLHINSLFIYRQTLHLNNAGKPFLRHATGSPLESLNKSLPFIHF